MRHAIARARERYRVELTLADVSDLSRAAATGPLVRIHPSGHQERLVKFGAVVLRAIYCPVNRLILTFLPRASQTSKTWKRGKGKTTAGTAHHIKGRRPNMRNQDNDE